MNAGNNSAREIFLGAIEKETPDQRATFLQAACGGDLAWRTRVEQLLRSYEVLGTFHEEDASPGREPTIDTTTLVLIAAACATVAGGRFRVRRIRRLLPIQTKRTPWSAQGRLILLGSHTVKRPGRPR